MQIDKSYWSLLDALHKAKSQLSEVDAFKAKGIIDWHREHDSLTPKQEELARMLIQKTKRKKRRNKRTV